jgi:hypothetical protein
MVVIRSWFGWLVGALLAGGSWPAVGPAVRDPNPPFVLGVDGPAFTIDGAKRFLVFVSDFDALDAPDIDSDFNFLASRVDGVRVFANWWDFGDKDPCRLRFSPRTLIGVASDGSAIVRPDRLARLRTVLDAARARHLLVDLTFAAEPVEGLSRLRADDAGRVCPPSTGTNHVRWDVYADGVARVAAALSGPAYAHVLFDLQNEAGHSMNGATDGDIAMIVERVHAADAKRLLSVSMFDPNADRQAQLVARLKLACLNFHDWPRGKGWGARTAIQVEKFRAALTRAHADVPIYAGEPDREAYGRGIVEFRESLLGARQAGAGAWTLHTRAAHDLAGRSLVEALDPETRHVLDSLNGILGRRSARWSGPAALGVD